VSFRKGLVEGSGENQKPAQVPVPDRILPFPMIARRRNPALSGPRSRVRQSITEIGLKPSPELAARKTADIRPTALREGQIAKARRVLGRRSRVTNSKEPGGLQEDAISIVSSPVINLRLHASS